jgi:uncharacterized membrane protein HdeD (DUF308 family)
MRPMSRPMVELLARNWWVLALRGALAVAIGIVAFLMPETALVGLVLLFAAYLLLDGVFAIAAGWRAAERHQRWFALVAEGVLGIAAALFIAAYPELTLIAFIYVGASWAILSGAALLVAARRVYRHDGEWLMLAAGALSLAWGVLVLIWPAAGVVVWAWWIGAYALLFGAMMLMLAFRLRRSAP